MIGPLVSLAKQLAIAAGKAAGEKIASALSDKLRGESSHPLTHRDVEHIRAQERASIEASKREQRDAMLRKARNTPPRAGVICDACNGRPDAAGRLCSKCGGRSLIG